MATGIKAIYENGVFKPTEPVQLKDKTEVEVFVPRSPSTGQSSGWAAWESFSGAWSDAPSDDIAERHDEHLYD